MKRDGRSLVPEAELEELFRPRRPDAAAFREGVASRIKAREAERETEERLAERTARPARLHAARESSAFWRKVAAILPPDLAIVALKAGKGWSAAALVPALALIAVFSAFTASLGSISRSTRNAAPPRGPTAPGGNSASRRELRLGAGLHFALQLGGLAAFILPLCFGVRWVLELILGLLLLSMLALVAALRGLSRSGQLERGAVLQLCVGLLFTVFSSCFLWTRTLRLADGGSGLGMDWGATVVLGGTVALLAVHRRSAPRANLALVGAGALLVFSLVFFPPVTMRSAPEHVRAYVEGETLHAGELRAWDEVSNSVEALAAVGASPARLEHVRREVARSFEADVDAHPRVWTAGARMGLVTREQWARLAERKLERHRLESLLARSGPLLLPDYNEYELHMLLALRELSAEEREHIARRVAASWPSETTGRALNQLAQCARWMDLLGRSEWVDARRAEAHAVLERHWVARASAFDRAGGFTSDPEKFPTSFADETLLGVELMARLGVPEGIDLARLRGHLRAESAWGGPFLDGHPYLSATERAALLRLERQIGLPEPSPLMRLLSERVLLGAVLLVVLCFVAVARTPAWRDPLAEAGGGAQP